MELMYPANTKKVDLLPVFITCDPARDSVAAVKAYVKGESLTPREAEQ